MKIKLIVSVVGLISSVLSTNVAESNLIVDGTGANIYYDGCDKVVDAGADIYCKDIVKVTGRSPLRVRQQRYSGIISVFVLNNVVVQ